MRKGRIARILRAGLSGLVVASTGVIAPAPVLGQEGRLQRQAGSLRPPWRSDRTPIHLRIPSEFVVEQRWDGSGGGAVVSLDYPGMRPFRNRPGCESGCPGLLVVTIRTGEESEVFRRVWRLRRSLEHQDPAQAGVTTPIDAPRGFTEAWHRVTRIPQPAGGVRLADTMIYLRTGADGTPEEFVVCDTRPETLRPYCDVMTTLDGSPSVQLNVVYDLDRWPADHQAIQAAIGQLVRSWL